VSDNVSRGIEVGDRWPKLVVNLSARARPAARPAWLPIAAFVLLLNGLMVTILAGFAGGTLLVPGLTILIGVAAIAAAFGLALQTAWGARSPRCSRSTGSRRRWGWRGAGSSTGDRCSPAAAASWST
jgi:hypothetical protein